jgi:hypothetical protein
MDILKLLQSGSFQNIVLGFICVNIALSATKQVLEKIKDKTATDGDNKAYDLISKISGILSKAIDYITANTQHK